MRLAILFKWACSVMGRLSLYPALVVTLGLVASPVTIQADKIEPSGTIYPSKLNYGVLNTLRGADKEDARVAVEMNFRRVGNRYRYNPDLEVTLEFLADAASTAAMIHKKQLHALSVSGTDFLKLRELAAVEAIHVTSKLMDTPLEPYVLLTKKGITFDGLAAMDQRRLMMESNEDWDIGRIWLETVLHGKGLPRTNRFFTSVETSQKPMRLILPIFFGKAEACLVPQSAYETMVELNPQIGQSLRVLLRSPGFVKSLVCVARHLSPKFVEEMKASLDDMHLNEEGRQILLLFQLRRNFPYKKEYLIETEAVYRKYRRITHPDG